MGERQVPPRVLDVHAYVPNAIEHAIAEAIGEHFGPFSFDGFNFGATRPNGRGDPLTGRGRGLRHGSARISNNLGLSIVEMCGKASLLAYVYIASPHVRFLYKASEHHPFLHVPEDRLPAWMYESAARAWPVVERAMKAIDAGAPGFECLAIDEAGQ